MPRDLFAELNNKKTRSRAEVTEEILNLPPELREKVLGKPAPTTAMGKLGALGTHVAKSPALGYSKFLDLPEAIVNFAGEASHTRGENLRKEMQPEYEGAPYDPVDWQMGQRMRGAVKNITGVNLASELEPVEFETLPDAVNNKINEVTRTAAKAGEAVGSSLGIAPGASAIIGGVTGGLEEFGVPPGWSDALAVAGDLALRTGKSAIQKLAARNVAKTVGKENIPALLEAIERGAVTELPPNFVPTTAQLAENPQLARMWENMVEQKDHAALASVNTANKKAIEDATTRVYPEKGTIVDTRKAIQQTVDDLTEAGVPHDAWASTKAGEKVRERVVAETEAMRTTRNKTVGPEYDKLKSEFTELDTPLKNYNKGIKTDFKYAKGSEKRLGKKVKQEGKSNQKRYVAPEESTEALLQELGHADPQSTDAIKNIMGEAKKKKRPPSWSEAVELRKELNSGWRAARKRGDAERQGIYGKLINNLDKDLKIANPDGFARLEAANKDWKKFNSAIDAIEDNPAYKPFLAKTKESQQFVMKSSEVAKGITEGPHNVETAHNFAKRFPEVINDPVFKAHINQETAAAIINPKTGKVTQDGLHAFKQQNPGFLEMYPEYTQALKNPQNANAWVNKTYKNFDKQQFEFAKGLATELLHEDVGPAVKKILGSKNPNKDILALKTHLNKLDTSGMAWHGVQNEIADVFADTVKNKSAKQFEDFMTKYAEALGTTFEGDQLKAVRQIRNAKDLQMKTAKLAKEAPNHIGKGETLSEVNKILKSPHVLAYAAGLTPESKVAAVLVHGLKKIGINTYDKTVRKILSDKNFATLMLSQPTTVEQAKKVMATFVETSNKARPAIVNLYEHEGKPQIKIEKRHKKD